MDYSEGMITVNERQAYHNCEMIFSMYYESDTSDFKVDKDQKYKIFTTIKEVEVLNEALELYQKQGFKDNYLRYINSKDGSNEYPGFVIDYIDSVELGKLLQALANDEDSLVQLSEYCTETAPTYEDDFRINKKIEAIIIDGKQRVIDGNEDLQEYIAEVRENSPVYFN